LGLSWLANRTRRLKSVRCKSICFSAYSRQSLRKVAASTFSPTLPRKLCREYALKQIDLQRTDFKRLGILGDWDNPYLTAASTFSPTLPTFSSTFSSIGKPWQSQPGTYGASKPEREYALKQIDLQRTDFKRLGILGDWDNPYLTMNYKQEADIVRALASIASDFLSSYSTSASARAEPQSIHQFTGFKPGWVLTLNVLVF
jgi:isoleucyl-tRNA synthetase